MVVLSGLDFTDWTDEHYDVIKEFLSNPTVPLICAYFNEKNENLTVTTQLPSEPFRELTYFMREPHHVFTTSNFHESILFGTVNDQIEDHALNTVENVFAPLFFKMTSWPQSIYNISFFCPIHKSNSNGKHTHFLGTRFDTRFSSIPIC